MVTTPALLVDIDERPMSPRHRSAAVLVAYGEFINGPI
jgi:hypothetical protein